MRSDRIEALLADALALRQLSIEEGSYLWREAQLDDLFAVANALRQHHVPGREVTWQIDRNINITNVCSSGCLFCNFHAGASPYAKPYITTREEYVQKIDELLALGGDQILLQGGLHPKLGLDFYVDLFSWLKQRYPNVKLHALGPPEVVHIARLEGMTIEATLRALMAAGLDSLPGAGAEILSERPRALVAPRKASADEWIEVMRTAQRMGLLTSATMMYGHVETIEERMEHLVRIRELQDERPEGSQGFLAFIAWPFQGKGTALAKRYGWIPTSAAEHARMVAMSRIMLTNVPHIQASWLTVGVDVALLTLFTGADDMGSIMVEENVVASAGAHHRLDADGMQRAIRSVGLEPQLRDQGYRKRALAGAQSQKAK